MSRQPQPWDVTDCGPADIEREAAKERRRARREIPARGVPTVEVGSDLPAIVRGSIAAMVKRGGVYVRGDMLVEPSHPEPERPKAPIRRDPKAVVLRPLSAGRLREVLGEAATYISASKEEAIQPPRLLAVELLERGFWDAVPYVETVATGPYIAGNRLVTEPGFDRETGTLGVFRSEDFPDVPARPSAQDVRDAVSTMQEWLSDFPFETEGDKVAAVAHLIESVIGSQIDGPRPLRMVDATAPGSGKGLLVRCAEIVGSGTWPAVLSAARSEDELRKLLLSIAVGGDSAILFDNIVGKFGNGTLAGAITARTIQDRWLGGNRVVTAPFKMGLWGTANNATLVGDLGRRVLPVRLDPQCAHPEDRAGFRISNLEEHVRQHRGRYYCAVLVLALAHVQAGRPAHGLPRWGSFESWDDAVRGPMIWCGLADPLAVRQRVREVGDADLGDLRRLHETWRGRFPTGATVREAITRALGGDGELLDALGTLDTKTPNNPAGVRVGQALRSHVGRVVDTIGPAGELVSRRRLVGRDGHGGFTIWRIEDLPVPVARGGDGDDGDDDPSPYSYARAHARAHANRPDLTSPSSPSSPSPEENGHPRDPEDEERQAIEQEGQP